MMIEIKKEKRIELKVKLRRWMKVK